MRYAASNPRMRAALLPLLLCTSSLLPCERALAQTDPSPTQAGSDARPSAAVELEAPQQARSPSPPDPTDYGAVATATRLARPLRQVASTVHVMPRQELDLNPGLTTDAVLRSEPSVATFRRSSSLTADPSAQGLNLRGVGPSGVSRSLVLLDGVPVNDPFAGSIYWRALPRLGLARAEIVPGGGSALYGSSALSGVVQLFSRDTRAQAFEGDFSYGSFDTFWLTGRGAGRNARLPAGKQARRVDRSTRQDTSAVARR